MKKYPNAHPSAHVPSKFDLIHFQCVLGGGRGGGWLYDTMVRKFNFSVEVLVGTKDIFLLTVCDLLLLARLWSLIGSDAISRLLVILMS